MTEFQELVGKLDAIVFELRNGGGDSKLADRISDIADSLDGLSR